LGQTVPDPGFVIGMSTLGYEVEWAIHNGTLLVEGQCAGARPRIRPLPSRKTENPMSSTKLFISHATDDRSLVKAFVGLLESGIGVPARDIFCSSLKGQGIKPGAEFKDSIREQLDDAPVSSLL
jgi:hypothetical protein